MKVLMAARYPVGGIRTFMRYVYAQPCFQDCQITLLAAEEDAKEYFGNYFPKERFEVEYIDPAIRTMIRALRAKLRSEKFDLLHSHGLTTGVAAEFARTGLGTPHVVTIHDVFLPSTFQGARRRSQQFGLNVLLRRCDAIHAVGQDCAENFRKHMPGVRAERVHAIRNGIDTQRFASAKPVDARVELGLPENSFVIGFFGRFMAQKGFRTLVDAIEILVRQGQPRPLRVLTFGWGGFIREDYEYLGGKGLEEHFVQCPETREPERWMKAVDVVAMPSRWEACPLQPMEALSAGVPFIGTNCIGLREVIAGSPALVAEIGDPVNLAARIEEAMNPALRGGFSEFMSEATHRFDVAQTAVKLRGLCGSITGCGDESRCH